MNHSTALYVAIFATVSLAVGWYGAKAWMAHGDVSGTIRKISGLKRQRSHNGGIALVIFLVAAVVLFGLLARHR
ncbi:MAG TPA: hypothetical protein VFQ44_27465 [Streptosporangiaceae bacterium]|nr:hypothetical protein [Streptosporangiaceae bacterium]